MPQKVRRHIEFSADLYAWLEKIACQQNVGPEEIIRRSLSIMKAFDDKHSTHPHIGLVTDPSRLDVEITGFLT